MPPGSPSDKEWEGVALVGEGGDEVVGEFEGVNHSTKRANTFIKPSLGIGVDILQASSKYTFNSINFKKQFFHFLLFLTIFY